MMPVFDGTNDYPTLQHLKEIVGKFDPEKSKSRF